MARTMLGQFVDELRKGNEGRPYDFICNHYWEMSKETLADIIKECICLDDSLNNILVTQHDVYTAIADNIEEWHEDELED